MKQKVLPIFVVLAVGLILAACGSSNQAASANAQSGSGNSRGTPGPRGFDPSKMTLQDKLAIGTLKLEGSKLAVDAKEAATLLPLWSAVQSLGTSDTTSQQEMDALDSQIQSAMTPDQVKAIDGMTFTQEDIRKLMADLGIDFGPSQGRTRIPGSNGSSAAGPGGPGGPGDFPGGGGFPPGGGTFRQGGNNGTTQSTPNPNRPRLGFGRIFIRPLITILKQRAES
jgi:hypothetical protein